MGWNPIPDDDSLPTNHVPSGKIRKHICQSLNLNLQDYKLYSSKSDDADDVFDDNYVIDLGEAGLTSNDPLWVKYEPGDNKSSSGSDSGDDDNKDNSQDNGSGNNDDNGSGSANRWVNYTRRLQNITGGGECPSS